MAHKGFIVTVEQDATTNVNGNYNLTVMKNVDTKVTSKYNLKAMEITEQADTGFKQYALNYEVSAQAKASMTATAALNFSAPIIKEN